MKNIQTTNMHKITKRNCHLFPVNLSKESTVKNLRLIVEDVLENNTKKIYIYKNKK